MIRPAYVGNTSNRSGFPKITWLDQNIGELYLDFTSALSLSKMCCMYICRWGGRRTAGSLMTGINFQLEVQYWRAPLYGFCYFQASLRLVDYESFSRGRVPPPDLGLLGTLVRASLNFVVKSFQSICYSSGHTVLQVLLVPTVYRRSIYRTNVEVQNFVSKVHIFANDGK